MEITSFSFGCTAPIPDEDTSVATSCSIEIVGRPDTPGLDVQTWGPYQYTVNQTQAEQGTPPPMTKVVVNALNSYFDFFVTSGPAGSTLFLDDVVLVQQSTC